MKLKLFIISWLLFIPSALALEKGENIFKAIGRMIQQNQIEAIILILICLFLGYIFGRFGRKTRVYKR